MRNKKVPVVVEDKSKEDNKKMHIRRIFGSVNNKEPPIEVVEFINFKPEPESDIHTQSFTMTVKFRGPNVLEGMKQCIQWDIADPPLPHYIEQIQTSVENSFYWPEVIN